MEGLPMYYLWLALVWAVLLGFSLWRLLLCRKRVRPVDREITWSVYLLTLPLLVLTGALFPDPPRPAAIAALVVWAVASGAISYRLNKRFNRWVEEQRRRRDEEP